MGLLLSRSKIVTTVIILLLLSVLFSGCTGEKRIDPGSLYNGSADDNSTNLELPGQEENGTEVSVYPSYRGNTILLENETGIEIELMSLSNIYSRDNLNTIGHNISERYFIVYILSIKNVGSKAFDLRSDEFYMFSGEQKQEQMFKRTTLESGTLGWFGFSDRPEIENNINDTTLLPDQNIHGSVIFSANFPYDGSFLLMYNTTPVNIPSLGKSLDALTTAELFNYSIAIGKPPYYADRFEPSYDVDTYNPPEAEYYSSRSIAYPLIWSNWVNRSIVEFYDRLDSAEFDRFKSDLPMLSSVYSSTVIPERNITILAGNREVRLIDDKGEVIINKSSFKGKRGISIRKGDTYTTLKEEENIDSRQMTFPHATVVHTTFDNYYGWSMATRINYNDQIVIFDEKQNISAVIYDYAHMVT